MLWDQYMWSLLAGNLRFPFGNGRIWDSSQFLAQFNMELGSGFVPRLIVFQLRNDEDFPDVNQLSVNHAETPESKSFPLLGVLPLLGSS